MTILLIYCLTHKSTGASFLVLNIIILQQLIFYFDLPFLLMLAVKFEKKIL